MVDMSALAGKPRGHDRKQKERWAENDKEIIYALMETFPLPLRIVDLQDQTGIKKRDRIRRHLDGLQKDMVVEEVHRGAWRIHPSTFYRESWMEAYELGWFTPKRIIETEG